MLEYLVSASDVKLIEKKYSVKNFYKFNEIPVPSVLGLGDPTYTITYENHQYLNPMRFGQSESNGNRHSGYFTSIFIDNPTTGFSYYQHMSEHYPRRCLAIVDAFIVSAADGKKYLIHLQAGDRAFALAGFYQSGKDETGKPHVGFALVTVNASPFLENIGVYQMPVIVKPYDVASWIRNEYTGSIIRDIFARSHEHELNGYPVNAIAPGPVTWDQLRPAGDRLKPFQVKRKISQPAR